MHKLSIIVATALAAIFVSEAQAQHWTSREDVAATAHQAADEIEHFHEVVENRRGFDHFAEDIHLLSEQVERFHRAVERGVPFSRLDNRFSRLQQEFYHVRSQVRRAARGDRHLLRDWQQAARAFHELEVLMGAYGARSHDRYDRYEPEVYRYDRPAIRWQPEQRRVYRWTWGS